jgi:hypothetical protein
LNTTVAGVEAYQTNDLLIPHPTQPGLWKIFGRADDQIILSTGEKVSRAYQFVSQLLTYLQTNPGPLGKGISFSHFTKNLSAGRQIETILCQDHHVRSAVMFGRGQFQNGVIVDPRKGFVFDPNDEMRLVKYRNAIW